MNKLTRFSSLKFNEGIDECVRRGMLKDIPIGEREDAYYEISKILNCHTDTVRKWRYKNSNGPSSVLEVNKLEELLGMSLRFDVIEKPVLEEIITKEPHINKEVDNKILEKEYTQFAKENINKAFSLMQDYINSQEVGEEERLGQFWCEFEKLKAGIPTEVYEKMENFSTENFDPMIWNFEPEITQEFLDCVNEVREKLSEFCEKEITPIVAY